MNLRGVALHAVMDENNEVLFAEHIKSWVPLLLELRNSRMYQPMLEAEWTNLADLSAYEEEDPFTLGGGDEEGR